MNKPNIKYKNSVCDMKFPFETVDCLVESDYTNRRYIRECVNTINETFFKKTHNKGYNTFINVDMHVIERLSSREFPIAEFFQIVGKLTTRFENKLCEHALTDERVHRFNCYGYGSWMVGVTLARHVNPLDDKDITITMNLRTCYAERNMQYRERNVSVEKIWTRKMPIWMKEIPENKHINDIEK